MGQHGMVTRTEDVLFRTVRQSGPSRIGASGTTAEPNYAEAGCALRHACREAAHAMLEPCASDITPTVLQMIRKDEMTRLLHTEPAMSDRFISHMLSRNLRIEEDLIDQLFNSSEKRLARALLLLARYGKQDKPVRVVPRVSQETLAEMIGTTRSRVNFFLNTFKKLGFIEYDGELPLKVNSSLLSVVLHD